MIRIVKYLFLLLFTTSFAQSGIVSNDWINYDQSYYKMPILQSGIYRITYNELIDGGVPVTTVNPQNIQIFGRGEEQYIYINGESDRKFDAGDYIEFYAEKNDGWLDQHLFSNPEDQGNPFYSMFNDTIYFFLTWNSSTSNRRIEVNIDSDYSNYTPVDFVFEEKVQYGNLFKGGELTFFNRPVPEYSSGEGWGYADFGHGGKHDFDFELTNVYASGPNATINVGAGGRSNHIHHTALIHQGISLQKKQTVKFDMINFNAGVSSSSLANSQRFSVISENSSFSTQEILTVLYGKITYPASLDFDNRDQVKFTLPSSTNAKDYLLIKDLNNNNSQVWLYDLTNHKKVSVQVSANGIQALVRNTSTTREMWLTSDAMTRSVSELKPVKTGSPKFTDYAKQVSDKGGVEYLIVTHSKLNAEAQDYANYRELAGKPTLLVDVEQLYYQYAFGIRKHPLSIRNFLAEALTEWAVQPEYLLLLGKSIAASDSRTTNFEENLVPTYGVPGADVGFSARLIGSNKLAPTIATGRIAARSGSDVTNYLNKVIEYEAAVPADWMKQMIHFGGGTSSGEQATFKNYLGQFEDIAEDSLFGAFVHTVLKTSADPLQQSLGDSVFNLISNGVTLMTFFGHAYGQNFDQSIEDPSYYDNQGRYNMILANSCLIGNIHGTSYSGSENFVLYPNRGSIAFLGSSTLGVPYYLYEYSKSYYENLSRDHYGESIGKHIIYTIEAIEDSSNQLVRDVCQHMTLHGDPAIILNSWEKQDYTLFKDEVNGTGEVYFSPAELTTALDSFDLQIVVRNIGKVQLGDTISVEVTRSTISAKDTVYYSSITQLLYKDTVVIRMPIDAQYAGINTFKIKIDVENYIDELSELNNELTVSIPISSDLIYPVYPYEFAIVSSTNQALSAYTSNPFKSTQTYVFEIDTNGLFNSSALTSMEITAPGGLVTIDPSAYPVLQSFYNQFSGKGTAMDDAQVFFWRVKEKNASADYWQSTSYQVVNGKTGWGQSHYHQFAKSDFRFVDYSASSYLFDFADNYRGVKIENFVSPSFGNLYPKLYYDNSLLAHYNGLKVLYGCAPMVFITVFDPVTLDPWYATDHGDRGHLNKLPENIEPKWNGYKFQFYASQYAEITSFLQGLPDSTYIALHTYRCGGGGHYFNSAYVSNNADAIAFREEMRSWGADIDSMVNYDGSFPYNFVARKGNPASAVETFSTDGVWRSKINTSTSNHDSPWAEKLWDSAVIAAIDIANLRSTICLHFDV